MGKLLCPEEHFKQRRIFEVQKKSNYRIFPLEILKGKAHADDAQLLNGLKNFENLDAFSKQTAAKGYPLSDGPHPHGRGGAIAFIDAPEGYEIELIQRGS